MEQREVTDREGTTWTCVQAYTAGGGKKAEKASKIIESPDQEVPVVCTPGGGAQSVRVQLPKNWLDNLPDQKILIKILEQKEKQD